MARPLTAEDLLPLVAKLSHGEQVRLAKLALRAAGDGRPDAGAYAAAPVDADELSPEDDGAAWDGEGWEGPDAPR